MKIAIIGSRNLIIDHLEDYIPKECTEIVSGGAKGIDACAAAYAQKNGLLLTEFSPITAAMERGHLLSAIGRSLIMQMPFMPFGIKHHTARDP